MPRSLSALDSSFADGAGPCPPVQVLCFGSPRVLHDDHLLWPAPGAGPTRVWELLLFLACQPPEGASRLSLVDALWPEADGVLDGGHVLRQLCYRLRTLLRCQVPGLTGEVVSTAAGVHRLDAEVVASAAQRFLALERAFRRAAGPAAIALGEQARSLYNRGRLLDGPPGGLLVAR